MPSIEVTNDFASIPEHLAFAETLWSNPGPVTISDDLIPDRFCIEKLAQITKANIHISGDTSIFWEQKIPLMKSVECLVIRGRIPERIIKQLRELKKLKKLHLDTVTSPSIQVIGELVGLTHLVIFYSNNNVSVSDLFLLKKLEVLALGIPSRTKKIDVINISNLKHLALGSCSESKRAELDSLKSLRVLSNLEYLSLGDITAKDSSLNFLAKMKMIKKVVTLPKSSWLLEI